MKSVLIYSGGLDSTVLLYKLRADNSIAAAISFYYGQRHNKEIEYAKYNCQKLGVKHFVADISSLKPIFGNSALTNEAVKVPLAEYNAQNMADTVVPNRNMIFLSIAAAYAITSGADSVAYAAHSGDHAIYADCRPEFAKAMQAAFSLCDYKKLKLVAPFVGMSKAEIAKLGVSLGVDFSKTWSCYNGGDIPCGKCATCLERNAALQAAGIKNIA